LLNKSSSEGKKHSPSEIETNLLISEDGTEILIESMKNDVFRYRKK